MGFLSFLQNLMSCGSTLHLEVYGDSLFLKCVFIDFRESEREMSAASCTPPTED